MHFSKSDIKKLILRVACKDDLMAFRELFDYYYHDLNAFSRHYVKSSQNAEEVVTDVFAKIWDRRAYLKHIDNFQAYLYTITKRDSLNYIRNHKLNNHLFLQIVDQFKVTAFDPEHEYLYNEVLKILTDTINDLPDKCQLVFRMVKERGMKYREVSKLLNISEKAVEMHISKALQKIRKSLLFYQEEGSKGVNTKKIVSIVLLSILCVS